MSAHITVLLGSDGLTIDEETARLHAGTPGGWVRLGYATGAVTLHTADLDQLAEDLRALADLVAELAVTETSAALAVRDLTAEGVGS